VAIVALAIVGLLREFGAREGAAEEPASVPSTAALQVPEVAVTATDEPGKQKAEPAEPNAPDVVVPAPDTTVEALRPWAESFYMNPDAEVPAQRYRFVAIDWYTFTRQLHASPAYLAAASGRLPLPIDRPADADFTMSLFPDWTIGMQIDEVGLTADHDVDLVRMEGRVISGGSGRFRVVTRTNENTFTGQIYLTDHIIRFDTREGTGATAIAVFDRNRLRNQQRPID
jgi:hypothetical protein